MPDQDPPEEEYADFFSPIVFDWNEDDFMIRKIIRAQVAEMDADADAATDQTQTQSDT